MNADTVTLIYKCRELIGLLIRRVAWSAEQSECAIKLGISNEDGWHKIISAFDLIDDTTSAIEHFLKFGLDGPTKYRDLGEAYLRLYGILNAVYLQQETISEIWSLSTHNKINDSINRFSKLRIREIRKRLGAHSINMRDRSGSYAPVQFSMSGLSCQYINNSNNQFETFDFELGIKEHYAEVVNQLYETIESLIKKADINVPSEKEEVENLFAEIKHLKDGNIILKGPQGVKVKLTAAKRVNNQIEPTA